MFYGYDEATALRQQHQRPGGKYKTGRTGQPRKPDSEIQRKAERRPYQQRGIFLPLRLPGPPDLGEGSAGKGKDLYKGRKGKCHSGSGCARAE